MKMMMPEQPSFGGEIEDFDAALEARAEPHPTDIPAVSDMDNPSVAQRTAEPHFQGGQGAAGSMGMGGCPNCGQAQCQCEGGDEGYPVEMPGTAEETPDDAEDMAGVMFDRMKTFGADSEQAQEAGVAQNDALRAKNKKLGF